MTILMMIAVALGIVALAMCLLRRRRGTDGRLLGSLDLLVLTHPDQDHFPAGLLRISAARGAGKTMLFTVPHHGTSLAYFPRQQPGHALHVWL
jgi:hypothetical protein